MTNNKKMTTFFIIFGLIGGLMVATSIAGYRYYSGKTNFEKEQKATEQRKQIKSVQNNLINGQEDIKSKTEEILSYQEEKVLSDLGVSIKKCFYSENYIDLNTKKYPKLKKLTFPVINIEMTNTGINPIKDIKIYFDYFFPLTMIYTIDIYTNSNKLSKGQTINYNSIPPIDFKDLSLFRLKMKVEWNDSKTNKKEVSYYYFELSNNSGELLYEPLNGTLDFHKDLVFDNKGYDLIAPKDFSYHRSSFIKDNYN